MSKRSDKPFVAVDCGLLSKELAASALFGHEKGAFTGADTKRKGYWEEADAGTLFLDEIGNLSLEVQQMMLRALESKRYRPVGSNKDMAADVRIIAATNEDMQSAVTEKPSGNSKDTLLISREISNPSANGLEFVLLFRLSKHRFPMPKLPKRRKGIGCKPAPY